MGNTTYLRLLILLAVATLLIAVLGLYLMIAIDRPAAPAATVIPTHTSQTRFTQPFTLTSQRGETVTQNTFLGKPTLYFFGYTHCPDVCPTTLSTIAGWLTQLGPDATKLNVVFVSIDPARDTPDALNKYVSAFSPHILGATGTPQQLETMAKQFMVYYAKMPTKPGENPNDYTMSHSSMILIADPTGTFLGTLDVHDTDANAVARLHDIINGK